MAVGFLLRRRQDTENLKMKKALVVVGLAGMLAGTADAGPLSYGICQSGCNALVVACYAAAGFVFGTVTVGVGTPVALMACNAKLGVCMAACVAAGLAPAP